MAHTPGPWRNETHRGGLSGDAYRVVSGSGTEYQLVAVTYGRSNATLIATSPDLRRLAQEIAALNLQDFDADMGETLIRRARALVVKADGAT